MTGRQAAAARLLYDFVLDRHVRTIFSEMLLATSSAWLPNAVFGAAP
jgi:hypothetical protein